MAHKTIAVNRRARREYHVLEDFEAGICLKGAEVKSIRAGQVNFKDAYVIIDDFEAWLEGLHIAVYKFAAAYSDLSPTRRRKLLLNKREIHRLHGKVSEKGLTIVPLAIYLKHGLVKIKIGLARGKHLYDKRHDMVKRDVEREIQRAIKERNR